MGRIDHMVCPSCASLHGRQHLPGCPRNPSRQRQGAAAAHAYSEGWDAARTQLLPSGVDGFRDRLHQLLRRAEDTLRHHPDRAAIPPDQAVQVVRAAARVARLLP